MRFKDLVVFTLLFAVTAQSNAIEMDSGVPGLQAESLRKDQKYLDRLFFDKNETHAKTKGVLGFSGAVNAESLQAWLNERVALVISESMDLEKSILVAPGKARYPEPKVLPKPDRSNVKPKPSSGGQGGSEPVLVMSNTGAALYMLAKQNQVLLALKQTNGKPFPLVSPREGVIQIGKGLFLEKFRVNPETQDHPANSLSRLSTLFHEARHSDGHGATLGFPHAICPEDHSYAGHPACDKNLNGPYTIGAQVLGSLVEACADCSTKEKTILKAIEADSRSRVLKVFKDPSGKTLHAGMWSDRPERMISFVRDSGHGLE